MLHPLEDPENKNFSYNTGNMDLVCMLNTSFSEGMVYCIMQEDGKRHIYEVNLGRGNLNKGPAIWMLWRKILPMPLVLLPVPSIM